MIGYRNPAHWSKRPLAVKHEYVRTLEAAQDMRHDWKSEGFSVRITRLVDYKRQDGTKVYYWKVDAFPKGKR